MLDLLFLSDNLAISIFSAVFHKFVSSDLCGSSTNGGKLFSPKYPPRTLASVLGCVVTLQLGAFSVVLETTLSGITALFPVAGYQLAGLPMRLCFQKLRMVLPLVCAVGLLNPLFDRQIVVQVGTLAVSGGVLSMLTLILKGVFCLLASFLLMATTTIEAICRALRQLHVPKLLTNLLLLTFRYVGLLLSEVAVMQQAYSLRAPGQKGIHISAWGSFLGQLLLRSMDRAEALYESMELRGYHGEFHYAQGRPSSRASWPFAIGCAALIVLARLYNLPVLLGGLFA